MATSTSRIRAQSSVHFVGAQPEDLHAVGDQHDARSARPMFDRLDDTED
jgi:hypothetical protein